MHVVPLTPHAKYDTACTIDERFEQPWQPLKGISIENIYVPELSYPNTIKGATWQKSIISRRTRNRIQKGVSPWIRGPGGFFWWRKGRKSRDTVALINEITVLSAWTFFSEQSILTLTSYFKFIPRIDIIYCLNKIDCPSIPRDFQ
jgi:hypothetical protein